jgi:hypothetical protein
MHTTLTLRESCTLQSYVPTTIVEPIVALLSSPVFSFEGLENALEIMTESFHNFPRLVDDCSSLVALFRVQIETATREHVPVVPILFHPSNCFFVLDTRNHARHNHFLPRSRRTMCENINP